MSDRSLLSPEVLRAKTHDRARRRHLFLAAAAAAIGGAVGSSVIVLGAFSVGRAQLECAEPTPAIALPQTSAAQVPPAPLIETLATPTPSLPPPARGRAAAILQADTPRLVIDASAIAEWIKPATPNVIEADDIHFILERPIATGALPGELADLQGQPVTLFTRSGEQCTARVGQLSAVRVVYDDRANPSGDSTTGETWDWGQPALVAAIDGLPDDCADELSGAVIGAGTFTAQPVATLAGDSVLAGQAVSAWRDTAGWKSVQRAYAADGGEGSWEQGVEVEATLIGSERDGLVVVNLSVGACGEFEGSHVRAFRVERGVIGEAVAVPAELVVNAVLGAVDSNGDGLPELITQNDDFSTDTLESSDSGYTALEGPDTTITFCRC